MDIGFIGLGLMGRPMALHLAKAGHRLHLWARRPASLAPFKDTEARAHISAAAVARHAEVVFTMVADAPDVREVCLGEDGLAAGAAPGLIVVDMSTINPNAAREIGRALAERDIEFLDAPVSGGETGAINAALTIMVGGKPAVFARIEPLLDVMGKSVTLIGDAGAGQVAKACNQMIMVSAIQACAEAFRLAGAHGVDQAAVLCALAGGSAGSRVLEVMGAKMVARDFAAGVEARLHHKDFAILMEEAARLGAPLPVAAQVWQQLDALMGAGWGRDDTASLLRVLEG